MAPREIILVTGGSSTLVSGLMEKIDRSRYAVRAVSRQRRRDRPGVTWLQGDVRDRNFVASACEGAAMVIHGAAVTHAMSTDAYMEVNVTGTKNLIDSAVTNDTRDFIFISSRTAGRAGGAYSLSKQLGEDYVRERTSKWLVFRPAEVFGTGGHEGLDKMMSDVKTKRIIPCPVGLGSRLYPIWVGDVVEIMYRGIFASPVRNQVVIINGSTGFTYRELVVHLAQRIDRRIVILPIPKALLFALKRVVELTGIRIGMVPDQVPRLCSRKPHAEPENGILAVGDYFQRMADSRIP